MSESLTQYRRRLGLCPKCGNVPEPPQLTCALCREARSIRERESGYQRVRARHERLKRIHARQVVQALEAGEPIPPPPPPPPDLPQYRLMHRTRDILPRSRTYNARKCREYYARKKHAKITSQNTHKCDNVVLVAINRYFDKRIKCRDITPEHTVLIGCGEGVASSRAPHHAESPSSPC
jgi:hypothetical protein